MFFCKSLKEVTSKKGKEKEVCVKILSFLIIFCCWALKCHFLQTFCFIGGDKDSSSMQIRKKRTQQNRIAVKTGTALSGLSNPPFAFRKVWP